MVERNTYLDSVFGSLADPTRRDILQRVADHELSISEIAAHYKLTFAAISKHLIILEQARLIRKRKSGKHQLVQAELAALKDATAYMQQYQKLWEARLDRLDDFLTHKQLNNKKGK
jgi:DNA-binding transcriptional ArsR family regulator